MSGSVRTFSSMDGHSLHSFKQQVLMNSIHIRLLLRKYENLSTLVRDASSFVVIYLIFTSIYQHKELLTGGDVFWRHSSKYTILASSLTYSTSYKHSIYDWKTFYYF